MQPYPLVMERRCPSGMARQSPSEQVPQFPLALPYLLELAPQNRSAQVSQYRTVLVTAPEFR